MRKTISPGRRIVIVLLPILLTAAALIGLYNLQIVHGADYYERSVNTVVSTQTVAASRGSILDRNGRVLVSNRIGYNISIDRERLVAGGDPNGTILTLVELISAEGRTHQDTMPISADSPFSITFLDLAIMFYLHCLCSSARAVPRTADGQWPPLRNHAPPVGASIARPRCCPAQYSPPSVRAAFRPISGSMA